MSSTDTRRADREEDHSVRKRERLRALSDWFRHVSAPSWTMAKYDPLQRFLSRQKTETVILSFREIEGMIGGLLPRGAETPDWWAADGEQNPKAVQGAAWARAGYSATLLKGEDRARFDRVGQS